VNPALIFQASILVILGLAGFVILLFNLKRYCDLTDKEDNEKH